MSATSLAGGLVSYLSYGSVFGPDGWQTLGSKSGTTTEVAREEREGRWQASAWWSGVPQLRLAAPWMSPTSP